MKQFNFVKLLFLTVALFGTVGHGFAQKKGEAINLGTARSFKESLQKQVSSKSSVNAKTGKPTLRVAVPGNKELSLDVNFQEDEKGGLTLVGRVNGVEKSTFYIQVEDGKLHGDIIMLEQKLAFEYGTREDGTAYIQEKDINKLVCVDYKVPPAETKSSKQKEESSSANARNLTLQSRPGAPYVIYLDFDGEHVPAGTGWNGGNAFYVGPWNVSSAVITEAWEIIAEDYRPFNVNVTTSLSVFNGYAATSRQRIIYTPDNNFGFYPNVGGGARYGTFRNNDWPCFVFMNGTGKWFGDIGSHEVGHTLDLEHDATYSNPGYYNGHNNWAPIMGSSYSPTERAIAQWSKGEYYGANMQQDDLAVIAYRIGYRGDDYGNSTGAATTLSVNSTTGAVSSRSGVIERTTDVDFFRFTTGSGSVSFNINTVSRHGNLDILARLYNSSGTLIASYNDVNTLNNTSSLHTSISRTLSAGTYYLSIDGTGRGTTSDGYSDYGSLGTYTITGTVKPPLVAVRHIEAENHNGESGTGKETCTDAGGGENLSQMHAGDYAYYNDINFPTSGTYLVEYRVASTNANGVISADLNNGATVLGSVNVPNTGGWQNWTTISRTVNVGAGTHRFGIKAIEGGWNLNWIKISKYSTLIQAENFSTMDGMGTEPCTDVSGGSNLSQVHTGDWASYYDVPFPKAGTYTIDYRVASTNGSGIIKADILNGVVLGQVNVPNTGGWQNWTTVSHTVNVTQGGFHRLGIEAVAGGWNLNWIRVTRKGRQIEAEDYTNMAGVNTQTCTDFGGGENVSHIDSGDWAYYSNISFPATGTYTIEYRVASLNGGGAIEADLNIGATVFPQVAVPATGGWQSWATVSQNVTVSAGTHRFGIKAVAGGWNLNWIRISKTGGGAAAAGVMEAEAAEDLVLYPNPAEGELYLRFAGASSGARVLNAVGQTVLTLPGLASGAPVDISSLRSGVYILEMVVDGRKVTKRFVKR